MRFICSFAWADLEVQPEEREFIARLINALQLDPKEAGRVLEWLDLPPRAEDLDPEDIPREHRQLFLDAARAVMSRDGEIDPDEAENFSLLEQLLR
jgi:tellurite resistance protein